MPRITRFQLNADRKQDEIISYLESCHEMAYDWMIGFVVNLLQGFYTHPCKWYTHREDLLEISNRFPDVLFTLNGEGEESRDIWKLYIRNGKSQLEKAEILIADFDESKLRN